MKELTEHELAQVSGGNYLIGLGAVDLCCMFLQRVVRHLGKAESM